MPYIEVISSSDPDMAAKQDFVTALTATVVAEFGVPPTAVTVFFRPADPRHYAYCGRLGEQGQPRVFIKFHAYRRDAAHRRAVAGPISDAACVCFQTPRESVSIYFFERNFDEVVHDGHLVSDGPLPVL